VITTIRILLGVAQAVAQAESSKGSDQVYVILNLLDYYVVVDQIFAICCDTTSSKTRAISVLTKALNILILRILCSTIISVMFTFPTSWKNSLAKYKAQGGAFMSVCRRHTRS
jgi:hypothetical protein